MTPDDLDRLEQLADQLAAFAYSDGEQADARNLRAVVARVRELEAAARLVLPYETRNPSMCDCPLAEIPPHRPHCYAGQFHRAVAELARVMRGESEDG